MGVALATGCRGTMLDVAKGRPTDSDLPDDVKSDFEEKEVTGWQRFTPDNTAPWALKASVVYCIAEDERGLIWLGTNQGLAVMDPYSERFLQLAKIDSNFLDGDIRDVYPRPDGQVWFSSLRGALAPGRRSSQQAVLDRRRVAAVAVGLQSTARTWHGRRPRCRLPQVQRLPAPGRRRQRVCRRCLVKERRFCLWMCRKWPRFRGPRAATRCRTGHPSSPRAPARSRSTRQRRRAAGRRGCPR